MRDLYEHLKKMSKFVPIDFFIVVDENEEYIKNINQKYLKRREGKLFSEKATNSAARTTKKT